MSIFTLKLVVYQDKICGLTHISGLPKYNVNECMPLSVTDINKRIKRIRFVLNETLSITCSK